jgi:hypothetical protein
MGAEYGSIQLLVVYECKTQKVIGIEMGEAIVGAERESVRIDIVGAVIPSLCTLPPPCKPAVGLH